MKYINVRDPGTNVINEIDTSLFKPDYSDVYINSSDAIIIQAKNGINLILSGNCNQFHSIITDNFTQRELELSLKEVCQLLF